MIIEGSLGAPVASNLCQKHLLPTSRLMAHTVKFLRLSSDQQRTSCLPSILDILQIAFIALISMKKIGAFLLAGQ